MSGSYYSFIYKIVNQLEVPGLSEETIREKIKKVQLDFSEATALEMCWNVISQKQILSEDFIREFQDSVIWEKISRYQKLSEDFIWEFQNEVDWFYISRCQKLSEEFIRRFKYHVYWHDISMCQKLSENFIEEFQNMVVWYSISKYQKLSENFIRKLFDKVDVKNVCKHQILTTEFIEELSRNLDPPPYLGNLWRDMPLKWKEKYIRGNTDYPIEDGMIIAYKSTRLDGYSCFNFQYKYEVGKEYEGTADHNSETTNSFGLSAWTRWDALNYYSNGKLFKVGIKLEDLACVVRYGSKLRARKIKILEEIER